MITSLVEPGGARPGDSTRRVVILTMLAYTALAAIFAGAASIGAGLAVLALGMLFTLLIDMRQWRDILAHDREYAPPEPQRAALPPQEKPRAIAAPTQAPMKTITTTRLLPYERAQEPVPVAAAPEPKAADDETGVVGEPEPKPQPQPAPRAASKTSRQARKPLAP